MNEKIQSLLRSVGMIPHPESGPDVWWWPVTKTRRGYFCVRETESHFCLPNHTFCYQQKSGETAEQFAAEFVRFAMTWADNEQSRKDCLHHCQRIRTEFDREINNALPAIC